MAKYSFDTKFSILMKDPEVMKIVDDLCPDLLNHPMKNMAVSMGFTPNMAMVVLSKMYSKEKIEEIGNGGMSGAPVYKKNLALVKYVHEKSEGKLPIIGVGGIMSGEQAKEMLDAGASLVEVYTGFIYEGPALIKNINKYLAEQDSAPKK